jgi:2-dehydro-3-deoxyphosphogluconate aldolase/(4S)-4-hydroxy-2-oxoglutarate aldolase
MEKKETLNRIKEVGLLAVLRGPSPEVTIQIVDALVDGGVKGIEVTFSTPNALEVVATLADKYGEDILLGMGTLTQPSQVASAVESGAQFLVSPMFETHLAGAMVDSGLPIMIGALTPSEVFRAFHAGSDVVKLFPGSLTGPSYLKALHGPFPEIPLMPTGGVNIDNVPDWFKAGAFAVGAGSLLCPKPLVQAGDFAAITDIAREFNQIVKEAQLSVQ